MCVGRRERGVCVNVCWGGGSGFCELVLHMWKRFGKLSLLLHFSR